MRAGDFPFEEARSLSNPTHGGGTGSAAEALHPPRLVALICDEWRRQRGIWFLLAAEVTIFGLAGSIRVCDSLRRCVSNIQMPVLAFLSAIPLVMFAARSFAVAREDASPNGPTPTPSRNGLFLARFLLCLLVATAMLLLYGAACKTGLPNDFAESVNLPGPTWVADAVGVLCAVSVASLCISSAAIAAGTGGGLMATLVGAVIGAALSLYWAYLALSCSFPTIGSWAPDWAQPALALVLAPCAAATGVAGWRCWGGATGRPRARLARLLLSVLAVAVLPCIPATAICAWVLFRATPDDYIRHRQHVYFFPSSAGRFMIVPCASSEHMHPEGGLEDNRVAIVDTVARTWRWLDPYCCAGNPYAGDEWHGPPAYVWSPDGKRCILQKEPRLAIPSRLGIGSGKAKEWVFDAATQSLREQPVLIRDDCSMNFYGGWFDNATLYCDDVPNFFLNIDTGQRSECSTPRELGGYLSRWAGCRVVPISGRGAYCWRSDAGNWPPANTPTLYIGRYAPDLPVAEHWILTHEWFEPQITDISPDGRLALVSAASEKTDDRTKTMVVFYIVTLDTGDVEKIVPPGRHQFYTNATIQPSAALFLPDGRRLAMKLDGRLCIFDMGSKEWRTYAPPTSPRSVENIRYATPSLSPNRRYAALVTEDRRKMVTVDMDTGAETDVFSPEEGILIVSGWLGDERLIVASMKEADRTSTFWRFEPRTYYLVNRDGTGKRMLRMGN